MLNQFPGKTGLGLLFQFYGTGAIYETECIFFYFETTFFFVHAIGGNQIDTLAFQFLARMFEQLLGFRSKADSKWPIFVCGHACEDIGILLQFM